MPDDFSDSCDNDADVFLCGDLPTISLMKTQACFLANKKIITEKKIQMLSSLDGKCKQSIIFFTEFWLFSVTAVK